MRTQHEVKSDMLTVREQCLAADAADDQVTAEARLLTLDELFEEYKLIPLQRPPIA